MTFIHHALRYTILTCAKKSENGRPPSRANANVNRETDASSANPETNAIRIRPTSITVPAALEPVACTKMAMIGNPVGVLSTSSILPRQKRRAMRKLKASVALMAMVSMMTFGTVVAAS